MRIIVCEDAPEFAAALKEELCAIFEEKQMACEIVWCGSGTELCTKLEAGMTADLLFMDIHLGDMDGVELIKENNKERIPTIFLSSLEDRIADGYDVDAVNFLLKRNYKERLQTVVERFLKENYQKGHILLEDRDTMVRLAFSEIYYVEADNRMTVVHTAAACYQEKQSISHFVAKLPENLFVEVYHSLYINLDHIRSVMADTVLLDNEKELPVSRRKRKQLLSAVMRRMRER